MYELSLVALVALAIFAVLIYSRKPKEKARDLHFPKPVPFRSVAQDKMPHYERKAASATATSKPKPKKDVPVQKTKSTRKVEPVARTKSEDITDTVVAASIISFSSYPSFDDSSDKGFKDSGSSFDGGGGDFGGGGASGSWD